MFISSRGMIYPEFNPLGSCAQGYQGILCSDCASGFSKTSYFECAACPDPLLNSLRLAGILVGVILLIILIVRSTLSGATHRKNVTSVYLKIMTNHMQHMFLTASFKFNWTDRVINLFEAVEPIA